MLNKVLIGALTVTLITLYFYMPQQNNIVVPKQYPKLKEIQSSIPEIVEMQIFSNSTPSITICNNEMKEYTYDEDSRFGRNCIEFEYNSRYINKTQSHQKKGFFQKSLRFLQLSQNETISKDMQKHTIEQEQPLKIIPKIHTNMSIYQQTLKNQVESYFNEKSNDNQQIFSIIKIDDIIFNHHNLTNSYSIVYQNVDPFEINLPPKNQPKPKSTPITPGKIIKSKGPNNQIRFVFSLQENEQIYKILDFIFNDRTYKSFSAFLLKKDYIYEDVKTYIDYYPGKKLYNIKLLLTNLGFQKINNIIESFFIYCESFRNKNFDLIISQVVSMEQNNFENRDVSRYTKQQIASNLLKYTYNECFTGDYLLNSVTNKDFQTLLTQISIENSFIFIESPNFSYSNKTESSQMINSSLDQIEDQIFYSLQGNLLIQTQIRIQSIKLKKMM